jgi:hypothetical protein
MPNKRVQQGRLANTCQFVRFLAYHSLFSLSTLMCVSVTRGAVIYSA